MATPQEVAHYLIQLAADDPESEGLTQMRLHKLLYYVQGWSLVFRAQPLFEGRIEAWRHGPVVKDIYRDYKVHGNQPIPVDHSAVPLSAEEQRFVQSVWLGYRRYSAAGLRKKTHGESPWINARKGHESEDRSSQPIQTEDLRHFFTKELSRHKLPGITLKLLRVAEREYQSGGGIPLTDLVSGK